MTPEFVAGVDIGTSSCKVALFDGAGAPIGFNRAGYPIARTAAGRAEQNPEDWWATVCAAMRRAVAEAGVPSAAVAAIGLSGQIGTQVLIDRNGRVVRPAISWQDARAQAEVGTLVQQVGRARLAQALGVDLPPGAAWPLPRLLWFKKHEPENLARAWRLLQPKDFVAHKLELPGPGAAAGRRAGRGAAEGIGAAPGFVGRQAAAGDGARPGDARSGGGLRGGGRYARGGGLE
jgi:sugar (pentulose or hexulose) kinase